MIDIISEMVQDGDIVQRCSNRPSTGSDTCMWPI